MRNALTIDVEDWYTSSLALFNAALSAYGQCPAKSVVHNTCRVLDLLEEYGHKATFFVLGTVAEYYPGLVREIYQRGHEIATHGYSHHLVYQMASSEFEADVAKAIELTEAITGSKIVGYRAPYFSLTRVASWAFNILLDRGIRYDSSIFPIHRGLYGDPGAPSSAYIVHRRGDQQLWEFPPSTIHILGQNIPIAGGSYLRLFPYLFIRWGIKQLNQAGQAAVVYLHPYELDPTDLGIGNSSCINISRLTRLTQGLGRGVMERKLRRLLNDFSFGPIAEVFGTGSKPTGQ